MEPTNTQTQTTQNQPVIEVNKIDSVIKDMRISPEWMITLVLAFFLGVIGVHRFYNGKIGTGILTVLTLGGFGIWVIIDLVMVLFGKFTKKDGTLITVRMLA